MQIKICCGTGSGKTFLSAFDSALVDAGVGNYNLIYLSSVIPKGAAIVETEHVEKANDYGSKLYVVMARCDQNEFGKEAWAGLGWIQDEEGRGLFVEHHAEGRKEVERLISNSLDDMREGRSFSYGDINSAITGIRCENRPVCAVVVAIYQIESFNDIRE